MQEGDHSSASVLLGLGADYASVHRSDYTKILFLLSKAMVNCLFQTILSNVKPLMSFLLVLLLQDRFWSSLFFCLFGILCFWLHRELKLMFPGHILQFSCTHRHVWNILGMMWSQCSWLAEVSRHRCHECCRCWLTINWHLLNIFNVRLTQNRTGILSSHASCCELLFKVNFCSNINNIWTCTILLGDVVIKLLALLSSVMPWCCGSTLDS